MSRSINIFAALAAISFMCAPAFVSASPKTSKLKGAMKFLSEAPLEKIVGTADGMGEVAFDPMNLSALKGKIIVPVKSMKTGNERRDSHLRSEGWLDEAKFPEITFVSKVVKPVGEVVTKGPVSSAKVTVEGDFTLHGVTKPLTAEVELKWKGDKLKLKTQFQIALADYNVAGTGDIVGSKVGKTIDVQVRLRGVVSK
ncbi:MAG: YceI family protein [Myxococcota bacterium]|nr:YceI family protein [Myxococcota bacterium]